MITLAQYVQDFRLFCTRKGWLLFLEGMTDEKLAEFVRDCWSHDCYPTEIANGINQGMQQGA